jgi:hypothetical protein
MLKRFTLVMSAVLGLLAFVLPSSAQSATEADSASKMNVQFKQSSTIETAATAPDFGRELEGRRRASRRRGGGSPASCPACGMG